MEYEIRKLAENLNLWNRAKEASQICIQNYILDGFQMNHPDFQNVKLEDFELSKKSQSLIFWQLGKESFIIRTTYDVKLENNNAPILGYYSLDVDIEGNEIDDWLIMK